jgi:hypothetical protein
VIAAAVVTSTAGGGVFPLSVMTFAFEPPQEIDQAAMAVSMSDMSQNLRCGRFIELFLLALSITVVTSFNWF